MIAEVVFWMSVFAILYTYFGYPLVLALCGRTVAFTSWPSCGKFPSVSVIIPAHNEEGVLSVKLSNLLELDYPHDHIEILVVSDGSTDRTVDIARAFARNDAVQVIEMNERGGKAKALNAGLDAASGEIIIFTDASILIEKDSLKAIVAPFEDPHVGCVSGEDVIPGGGGEGTYGRYELFVRKLESRLGSIVAASGSFYAQRKSLCEPFLEGLAPDFLSVLTVVRRGYRAVSEPAASGTMRSAKEPAQEFKRKVRTLVRGMTALSRGKALLNPFRYGVFSLMLISHKLLRWCVPFFLIAAFMSSGLLWESVLYRVAFIAQCLFYLLALLALPNKSFVSSILIGKIPRYFAVVNAAALIAWMKYLTGFRQELWEPTRRGA